MSKPTIPQGTRDFGATELKKRYYLVNTIKQVFECYGYTPLETPTMENLNTLTGKYGDEGEKLLYRVLNSGDFLSKTTAENFTDYKKLTPKIAEKGLRYDLTVPFARYVVMHQHELTFPYKRYQIQPVWRADRPQKGRYREFYQCDADVVGTTSLLNEAELTQMYDSVFAKLGLKTLIKINNRKILQAIAHYANAEDSLVSMTIAIDKLDKIGRDGVAKELTQQGFSDQQIESIFACIFYADTNNDTANKVQNLGHIELLQQKFADRNIEVGLRGIAEMKTVLSYLESYDLTNILEFDATLARGLGYYTGTIWEVKANEGTLKSSIGGGGRYDDLTSIFGLKNMSGVGISFGLDRIYDILEETNKWQLANQSHVRLMFINFGGNAELTAFQYVTDLRKKGLAVELYPEAAKMDKQMKYANALQIPLVGFVGEEEIKNEQIKVKNMQTGAQQSVSFIALLGFLTQV